MKSSVPVYLLVIVILMIAALYKFRIQEVCVPVFINLNAKKYIVLRQDTLSMAPDCGLPIKKIYYMERL
jgi:hypothetical protein